MDPERPIEKLLRQAAQSRRAQAGAPQELHPANRRVLQSEVARKYAAAAPERRSFFELFIPRLAWGAAVIVGLGLAASLMLPRQGEPQREMFFAKNDRLSAPQTVNEALPPAAASSRSIAPTEAPALARSDVAQTERDKDAINLERHRMETQKQPLALNEPAAAAKTGTSIGGSLAEEKLKSESTSKQFSAAPPPQTPVPDESMLRRRYGLAPGVQSPSAAPSGTAGVSASSDAKPSDEMLTSGAYKITASSAVPASSSLAVQSNSPNSADVAKRSPAPIARATQRFVETASVNKNVGLADTSAVAKPILVSFELQQVGRDVRIVDSDGSIYSGSFQSPESLTYLDAEVRQQAAVTRSLQGPNLNRNPNLNLPPPPPSQRKDSLSDSKLQTDLSYAFKVTGTNQSLNQIVTFTGQLLAPTNALSLIGGAGTVNGNRLAPPELNPLPLQNSRISGKAIIGTNKEVDVNAIPSH